jgi:PTH1 family peptidyl-tRNA hydrolase
MSSSIKLFIGLCNPGKKYEATRHNAGQWFIENLFPNLSYQEKFKGLFAKTTLNDSPAFVLLPQTYMNLSGESVKALIDFYKISVEEMCIVHDEIDLAVGDIRLKKGGGHAGHNGLRSIIECVGSPDFYRLRIGVGRPPQGQDVSDYVLSAPPFDEKNKILESFEKGQKLLS